MWDDNVETERLQSCVNDLTSLIALPPTWVGCEPPQVLTMLLDVVVGMLRLDFAYAGLGSSVGQRRFQVIRTAAHDGAGRSPAELEQEIERWLAPDAPGAAPGALAISWCWLGIDPNAGVVVAGSHRPDFPSALETVLLRVAVNQAAIQIQEATVRAARQRAEENRGTATLVEVQRQHIRRALDESRWIVAGPSGAAAKLGMKRTSLQYKMQKLGISRAR